MDELPPTPQTPPNHPPIIPLVYAPGDTRKRRRFIKWSIVLALLISLAIIGRRYGPHAWLFARQYYWQRQCMNFDPPADAVVYLMPAAAASAPAVAPPYMNGASPEVPQLQGYMYWSNGCSTRAPIDWVRFLDATSNKPVANWGLGSAVAFCHERISSGGHHRLVTVEFTWMEGTVASDGVVFLPYGFCAQTYAPAQWNGCPPLTGRTSGLYLTTDPPDEPKRVFAGQADPADGSHFSIEYEWADGLHGFVDGWLEDDETVKLAIRPGPGDIESHKRAVLGLN
jgi:hypothetical protein